MLKGREEAETKAGELTDDMTDIIEASMATIEDKDLNQLVTQIATARAKKMGEKVKKSLNLAARQVSIVPRLPRKQNVAKETNKKFEEIDPVRVDTSSLTPQPLQSPHPTVIPGNGNWPLV